MLKNGIIKAKVLLLLENRLIMELKVIRELPWITDGANLFLQDRVQSGEIKNVLEFGSGASTIWFLKNGLNVISIEHDKEWYDKISGIIQENNFQCEYILAERPYSNICEKYYNNMLFDLVIVDGRDRVLCVEKSKKLVKPNKFLMLDNDEREQYKKAHKILESWQKNGFVQEPRKPDLCGWVAPHPWVTTVWKNT